MGEGLAVWDMVCCYGWHLVCGRGLFGWSIRVGLAIVEEVPGTMGGALLTF